MRLFAAVFFSLAVLWGLLVNVEGTPRNTGGNRPGIPGYPRPTQCCPPSCPCCDPFNPCTCFAPCPQISRE